MNLVPRTLQSHYVRLQEYNFLTVKGLMTIFVTVKLLNCPLGTRAYGMYFLLLSSFLGRY